MEEYNLLDSSSGHPFKGRVPASVDVALVEGRLGAVCKPHLLLLLLFRLCSVGFLIRSVGIGLG